MLLAIAGGAPPGAEDMIVCCGVYVVAPLVLVLAYIAVTRQSILAGVCSVFLSSGPLVLIVSAVMTYQPSDDADVQMDQGTGWCGVVLLRVGSACGVFGGAGQPVQHAAKHIAVLRPARLLPELRRVSSALIRRCACRLVDWCRYKHDGAPQRPAVFVQVFLLRNLVDDGSDQPALGRNRCQGVVWRPALQVREGW